MSLSSLLFFSIHTDELCVRDDFLFCCVRIHLQCSCMCRSVFWKRLNYVGVVGWTGRIWDDLYAGCIPVVIAESTFFPFETMIDYSKFSLRFSFDELEKIEDTLMQMSPEQRDQMQAEGLKVRDHFVWPATKDILHHNVTAPSALHNLLTELRIRKAILQKMHNR